MNKESKSLPQAIKLIVDRYGKDVLNDVRLVNIISDVVTLEEPNSIKTILKECIRLGYGRKILAITPKDDLRLKVKAFSIEISDSYGFKEVIVQYILYSMAFSIGICPQPYLKNQNNPQKEKDKILRPNNSQLTNTEEMKRPPYRTMAACFVILIIFTFFVFGLRNASEQRQVFKNKVFTGDSLLKSADYDNAIEKYKDAYNSYNAMNSGSYKEEALGKIDEVTEMLLNNGKTDSKSLSQAHHVLQSEMQLNLEKKDKERLQAKLEEVETIIANKIENGRNALITNLSANNGKLDENGNKLLLELLILSPNDYWLNFIKNKNNE